MDTRSKAASFVFNYLYLQLCVSTNLTNLSIPHSSKAHSKIHAPTFTIHISYVEMLSCFTSRNTNKINEPKHMK